MPSRREFLVGVVGLVAIRGPRVRKKGTPVHERDCPAESLQQLIEQVRFLEQGVGRKEHVQAIQDQIRVRLLLAGLACIYAEGDGRPHVCALETSTGCLWCLPVERSVEPWACEA